MTSKQGPRHVVVDGSNIATEGRSMPSLTQLSDAVTAFMEEHPDTAITVVVDATFGHRIDKKEVAEFEAGISNNELVAPPAGAIGRGDAFVLSIAQKAGASILSNDSFQEFHPDYPWLFDEGRLIGGKPVPHVGWVFVNRSPVRGPVSRKATQGAKGRGGRRSSGKAVATSSGSPLANEPMPVPKTPPPTRAAAAATAPSTGQAGSASGAPSSKPAPRAGEMVNELMPFLEFVEHHPVGTSVNGIVDSYASHGAYISIGSDGVRGYIPLRLMGDPPPPSARKVMQLGEAVTAVVVSFAAARRSIDCALPDMAAQAPADPDPLTADPGVATPSKRGSGRGRGSKASVADMTTVEEIGEPTAAPSSTSTRTGRKRGGAVRRAAEPAPDADAATTEQTAAKRPAAKKAAAKKAAAPTAAAKPTSTRKRGAGKQADATTADPVEPSVTDTPTPSVEQSPDPSPVAKAPAKRAPAKRAPAKKAPAKQPAAESAAVKEPAARKAPAKRPAAKKTAAKQPAAKRAPAEQPAAKKAAAKKAPAEQPAAEQPAAEQPAAKKTAAKKAPAKTEAARSAPRARGTES